MVKKIQVLVRHCTSAVVSLWCTNVPAVEVVVEQVKQTLSGAVSVQHQLVRSRFGGRSNPEYKWSEVEVRDGSTERATVG